MKRPFAVLLALLSLLLCFSCVDEESGTSSSNYLVGIWRGSGATTWPIDENTTGGDEANVELRVNGDGSVALTKYRSVLYIGGVEISYENMTESQRKYTASGSYTVTSSTTGTWHLEDSDGYAWDGTFVYSNGVLSIIRNPDIIVYNNLKKA